MHGRQGDLPANSPLAHAPSRVLAKQSDCDLLIWTSVFCSLVTEMGMDKSAPMPTTNLCLPSPGTSDSPICASGGDARLHPGESYLDLVTEARLRRGHIEIWHQGLKQCDHLVTEVRPQKHRSGCCGSGAAVSFAFFDTHTLVRPEGEIGHKSDPNWTKSAQKAIPSLHEAEVPPTHSQPPCHIAEWLPRGVCSS